MNNLKDYEKSDQIWKIRCRLKPKEYVKYNGIPKFYTVMSLKSWIRTRKSHKSQYFVLKWDADYNILQSYLAVLCFLFLSEEKTEQLLDCKQEFEQMEAELKRLQQEVWVLYIYCLKKSGQKEVAVTRTPPPPFFFILFFFIRKYVFMHSEYSLL